MNRIPAQVTRIERQDDISVVTFDAGGTEMRMMALGLNLPITEGSAVILGVKATNVALSIGPVGENSISNRLKCDISALDKGALLCSIRLRFGATPLECITTMEACKRLMLKPGEEVTALIKASELSILEVIKEEA